MQGGGSLTRAAAIWLGLRSVLYNDPGMSKHFPELCEPFEEIIEPEGMGTPVTASWSEYR